MSSEESSGMMSNDDRLVYMLNQIARNFAAIGHDQAAAATADHIRSFWDPRMMARIRALAAAEPQALLPTAGAALAILDGGAPAPQTAATEFAQGRAEDRSDAG